MVRGKRGNKVRDTAIGPMVILAIEQHEDQPLVRSALARRFLPMGSRLLTDLHRWTPIRRWFINALERQLPGGWANFVCRKRYIDDRLCDALGAGIAVVVNLGAGLDDRAFRLPALSRATVYEVDLPANIRRKRELIRRADGRVPDRVRQVATNFDDDDLSSRLAEHGYRPDQPTFFIWEAVTQYLTEAGVRRTFDFLSNAAPGSQLAATYVDRDFLEGTNVYGAQAVYERWVVRDRLFRFGWHPDSIGGFLTDYGWRVIEQAGQALYTERYLRPVGRDLAASDMERCVWAEKR